MSKDVVIQRVPKEITVRNLPKHFNMKDRLFILKLMQENYKQGFLNGLKFLFIIILFCSIGCSRKVVLNKSTEKAEIENELNTGVFNNDIIFNDIFKIEPFDVLKPMVINGKEYVNVIITNDKTITKKNTIYINKTRNITKTITITKIKQTEKSDYTFMIIGLAALVLIALKFKLLSFGNN